MPIPQIVAVARIIKSLEEGKITVPYPEPTSEEQVTAVGAWALHKLAQIANSGENSKTNK